MDLLLKEIKNSLEELSEAKRLEYAKKSHPTNMHLIGVSVPNLKIVLKELKVQTKNYSIKDKLELAKTLINQDVFELQQMAYEYLDSNKKVLKNLNKDDIDDLGHNLDNWLSVDYFAALIVGFAWREGIISIDYVKKYFKSDNFWIRRIPIVATVALNQKARGGKGDSEQTLEICELAIDDHNEMIVKALSWAIRELIKVDKKPVFEFVEKNNDRLHKKVLREVRNKLETGKKN